MHVCERCHSTFNYKSHLKIHLQKKRVCEPTFSTEDVAILMEKLSKDIPSGNGSYVCEFCTRPFNHASNKYSHKKTCKANPVNLDTITITKEEYNRLQAAAKELDKLKRKIARSAGVTSSTLKSFGEEDLSHLSKSLEYYWINKAIGLIEMTKDVYFDEKHPKNHTFTITNQRKRLARVRVNGIWQPKSCDEAIDEIVYIMSMELDSFVENKRAYLEGKYRKAIVDDTIDWWNSIGTNQFDNKEYNEFLKDLIEMVIMNRHIIKKKPCASS